jgi:hypothetical protein
MFGLPADGSLLEGMNQWKTKEGRKESLKIWSQYGYDRKLAEF